MKMAVGVVLALAVIVGGGLYFTNRSGEPAQEATEPVVEQTEAEPTPAPKTENTPTEQPGAYVDYTDTIIASTAGTKILFFHAPWCPQCRALESSIKSSQIPNNVTIIKVDYDSHQKLRQQYGVTIQTSLVKVDDAGKLVEKYVAYDEPTFAALKSNLL